MPGRPTDFSALAEEVAELRGLAVRKSLRARVVSPQGLADKVAELATSELNRRRVEADRRLLVTLRLAPDNIDLQQVLEDLYREQILGVYVPEETTLYVRQGPDELTPGGAQTAVHELTHALQDQHFDLDRLREDAEEDADASLALLSLIEGDAVLTQQRWSFQQQSVTEQEQAAADQSTGSEAFQRTPQYLRNGLLFPYVQGVQFVTALLQAGGAQAVDRAFADPPTTTEQILHPEVYLDGDGGEPVTVTTAPGRGWRRSTDYEFGEFDLRELFAVLGAEQAADVGGGWDGGALKSWTRGDHTAVAALLRFDTPDDAAEACEAVPEWYVAVASGFEISDGVLAGDEDHLAYVCDNDAVSFALAPDAATARRLTDVSSSFSASRNPNDA